MYICLCSGVSDRQIKEALLSGKAHDFDDLQILLQVGIQCGGCIKAVHDLITTHNQLQTPHTLIDTSEQNS